MGFLYYLTTTVITILLAIPILHLLASVMQTPIFSFLARVIASWFALVVCACYGVVASVALRLAGYGGLSQWTTARAFKYTMWALTGVEFEIHDVGGGLSTRPGVFIGNHQT